MDSFSSPSPHFLDGSPLLHASSIGGPDLSLSELTLSDIPPRAPGGPRFSIFADSPEPPSRHHDTQGTIAEGEEELEGNSAFAYEEGDGEGSVLATGGHAERPSIFVDRGEEHLTAPQREWARENKLRSALVTLKQMNSVFSTYLDALRAADEKNRKLAEKVNQTNQLLDQYVGILGQSEHTVRLLLDKNWQGATVDEDIEEQERLAAEEEARREAEAAAERARAEKERRIREEQERLIRAEKEQAERERAEKDAARGLRGRGRGLVRGSAIPARGRGIPTRGGAPSSSTGTKRHVPSSSTSSTRSATSGTRGGRQL